MPYLTLRSGSIAVKLEADHDLLRACDSDDWHYHFFQSHRLPQRCQWCGQAHKITKQELGTITGTKASTVTTKLANSVVWRCVGCGWGMLQGMIDNTRHYFTGGNRT
jgi:hypothetical protein